jgi:L-lactate dehydrogenase complex protein LldG
VFLNSGADNPTTLNFLPENHIVVLRAADIEGNFEACFTRLRAKFGAGQMPRVLNMISGPSRTGDIEQTILLGAHGPKRMHIIIVR